MAFAERCTSTGRSSRRTRRSCRSTTTGSSTAKGVYETLRTYNRVPFLYDRHMRAAARVGWADPARRAVHRRRARRMDRRYSGAPLDSRRTPASDAAKRGLHPHPAHPRRRRAELRSESTPTPTTSSSSSRSKSRRPRVFTDGINICLVPSCATTRQSVNPLIKSNNLLNNALAMQEAYRRGGEEGLMCNYRGELSECSQANFFMVRGGVVLTPQSEAGLLEGITRAFLFEVGTRRRHRRPRGDALPEGSRDRRRSVHHQHDARAEPGHEASTASRSAPARSVRSPGGCSQGYRTRAQELTHRRRVRADQSGDS